MWKSGGEGAGMAGEDGGSDDEVWKKKGGAGEKGNLFKRFSFFPRKPGNAPKRMNFHRDIGTSYSIDAAQRD